MRYMSEYEIDMSVERFSSHPVLNRATKFLASFKNEVDGHSDGWAYWKPPVQSAAKLMQLIQDSLYQSQRGMPITATSEQYRKTLAPIKAFYTRRGNAAGMQWPIGDRRDEA